MHRAARPWRPHPHCANVSRLVHSKYDTPRLYLAAPREIYAHDRACTRRLQRREPRARPTPRGSVHTLLRHRSPRQACPAHGFHIDRSSRVARAAARSGVRAPHPSRLYVIGGAPGGFLRTRAVGKKSKHGNPRPRTGEVFSGARLAEGGQESLIVCRGLWAASRAQRATEQLLPLDALGSENRADSSPTGARPAGGHARGHTSRRRAAPEPLPAGGRGAGAAQDSPGAHAASWPVQSSSQHSSHASTSIRRENSERTRGTTSGVRRAPFAAIPTREGADFCNRFRMCHHCVTLEYIGVCLRDAV